ncbi:energy transducer TonB [Pedobacter sp. MW01-1-1]|uniref:energy transducer TonB n=1 Tax=Pedobacter sp. MW01-1-1 TaxID=3383027 RepID=UPI003FEF22EB
MFNSSINVYKIEWLDLVFSNRNKNYGAYALRKESSSILTKALFAASTGFILLFTAPLVYSKLSGPEMSSLPVTTTTVDLSNQIHEMKPEKKPDPKPEPAKSDPVKVKTVAVSSNIVVTEQAKTPPPTLDDMRDAVISNVTQDGIIAPDAVILPKSDGSGNGTGTSDAGTGTGSSDMEIYLGADENPEFAGGMKGWAKYLQKNLDYPTLAQDEQVQGRVVISFVVEKDGSITDVKLIKGIGFGCDEEAMRVIKKSPFWKPGKNRGTPVRVRYNMPITFTIN